MNPEYICLRCGMSKTDSDGGYYYQNRCDQHFFKQKWKAEKWSSPAPKGPSPEEVAETVRDLEKVMEELS